MVSVLSSTHRKSAWVSSHFLCSLSGRTIPKIYEK